MTLDDLLAELLTTARNMELAGKRFSEGGSLAQALHPATAFGAHAAWTAEASAAALYGGRLTIGTAYRPRPGGLAGLHMGSPLDDGHMARLTRLANDALPLLEDGEQVEDAVRRGLMLALEGSPEGLRPRSLPLNQRLPMLRLELPMAPA